METFKYKKLLVPNVLPKFINTNKSLRVLSQDRKVIKKEYFSKDYENCTAIYEPQTRNEPLRRNNKTQISEYHEVASTKIVSSPNPRFTNAKNSGFVLNPITADPSFLESTVNASNQLNSNASIINEQTLTLKPISSKDKEPSNDYLSFGHMTFRKDENKKTPITKFQGLESKTFVLRDSSRQVLKTPGFTQVKVQRRNPFKQNLDSVSNNSISENRLPISGPINQDFKKTVDKKNAHFLNRVFKIICRDNQYPSCNDSSFEENSEDSSSVTSRTTMFNRGLDKIRILSGKYRNPKQLSSTKIIEKVQKLKQDQRSNSRSKNSKSVTPKSITQHFVTPKSQVRSISPKLNLINQQLMQKENSRYARSKSPENEKMSEIKPIGEENEFKNNLLSKKKRNEIIIEKTIENTITDDSIMMGTPKVFNLKPLKPLKITKPRFSQKPDSIASIFEKMSKVPFEKNCHSSLEPNLPPKPNKIYSARSKKSANDNFISKSYKRDPVATIYYTSMYNFTQSKAQVKNLLKGKRSLRGSIDTSRLKFMSTDNGRSKLTPLRKVPQIKKGKKPVSSLIQDSIISCRSNAINFQNSTERKLNPLYYTSNDPINVRDYSKIGSLISRKNSFDIMDIAKDTLNSTAERQTMPSERPYQ